MSEAVLSESVNATGIPYELTTAGRLADLEKRRAEVLSAGSERSVAKQHARGKMTARERLDVLLDPGSFVEIDEFVQHRAGTGPDEHRPHGDGVVTGLGTVDGRKIAVYAQDFTVLGGSVGETHGRKIVKVMRLAADLGCPIVGLCDSAGARIQEGVEALAAYAEIGYTGVQMSGIVPQISVIMGPCAGGAVYIPVGTDYVAMVNETAHMFITGPEIVAAVTGEQVTADELGGGYANAADAGNVHYLAENEKDALDWVRTLLGFLPANNLEDPPVYDVDLDGYGDDDDGFTDADLELDTIIPDSGTIAYDMEDLVRHVLDNREFVEIQALYGRSLICGYGRVAGRTVGVLANQPRFNAGSLDGDTSDKGARFVRTCNAFNLPILMFVDVPGYLPGVEQERLGIIRRGSKLPFAYSEATVPKITVVVRKAYGGGYAVMGSKHIGADLNLAWPTAEIAVMGGQGAVSLLFRADLETARAQGREAEVRRDLVNQYDTRFGNPYDAAARGYVDAVIAPRETRRRIAEALPILATKRRALPARKHSNIPM
jgi:acetyl-CoA carboxylase carboxyltransferase component